MTFQDTTLYEDTVYDPALYEAFSNQLLHAPYVPVDQSGGIEFDSNAWWSWPQPSLPECQLVSQQYYPSLSPIPEHNTPCSSGELEGLLRRIVELEKEAGKVEELESRIRQIEEAGRHTFQGEEAERRICQIDDMEYRIYQMESAAKDLHEGFVTVSVPACRWPLTYLHRYEIEKTRLCLEIEVQIEKLQTWAEQVKKHVESSFN